MAAKGPLVGIVGLALVLGACTSGGDDECALDHGYWETGAGGHCVARVIPAGVPAPVVAPPTPATAPVEQPGGPAYPAAPYVDTSRVTVTRVIDGDTFEIKGGQKVRVLGIDSCEMSTPGGKAAKSDAEGAITGITVTLVSEPGVDKDRYGRLLRYVKGFANVDLGTYLVRHDHTGVYQGKNDASAAYLAELRTADTDGRNCSGAPPAPAPSYNEYNNDDNGGGGGGESRFCRKRRWC